MRLCHQKAGAMSFRSLYWGRIIGAVAALFFAVLYLAGQISFSLVGFAIVAFFGGVIGYRLNCGTLPAICDLCGARGLFSAEYGYGFQNARLILNCPSCGRVINRPGSGVCVDNEKRSS